MPYLFSGGGVEAVYVAFSAEGVYAVAINGGCREWACWRVAFEVEAALVWEIPDFFARCCIEAVDDVGVRFGAALCAGVTHGVKPAFAYYDRRQGGADCFFPYLRDDGVFIDDELLNGDSIVPRAP